MSSNGTPAARDQRPPPRPRLRAAAVALALAGVLAATAPTAQAAAHGGTGGSRCGGRGVDSGALIRYESDILVKAPLRTVWKLQTDVERWPSWQPPVTTMERLDQGPLRKGSRFRWTTPAPATPTTPATTLEITSTVQRLRDKDCILWKGPATGEGLRIDEGVHLWTFRKVRGGVRVHTEETWTGDQVEADVRTATEALGQGLEAWLRDLKATAEARSGGRPH
ncbi:SRPBCC family protein [Streptomyces collinus]|uniref:Membrane protein n=1 Tax=Streptomyces collinus TaxID=42684 RepID=A0AA89Q195_STRCU|nr:SRPBCC family protein [Streptomyces collinus]MBB5812552.1 putative membrane protein [Streptomyces collinus]WMX65697.1 SRPBCC family protein [Streptomyces collinus]